MHEKGFVDPGSFRDRGGRVVHKAGRIYRAVMPIAAEAFTAVRRTGLLDALAADGALVAWRETERDAVEDAAPGAALVLEHERLPYISYPFEWPFAALKAAALLHLDIHLRALAAGVTMADASAYNIQFVGSRPIFIDHLSFRPYVEGEVWAGYRQFCEQFLHPLLLQWATGAPFQPWFRGAQEGVVAENLLRLLPWRARWNRRVLTNVVLPAKLERSYREDGDPAPQPRPMPKRALVQLLNELRAWVADLEAPADKTVWRDYTAEHGYAAEEAVRKREAVKQLVAQMTPGLLLDIGCNTGEYAVAALQAGAGLVVGLEADVGAAELAFRRSAEQDLRFLPLIVDVANPSPGQGWAQRERKGTAERGPADALLALALIHHLAIGRNIPLAYVVEWLIELAPMGVIEFVPKQDPQVQRLLASRADVFDDYSEDAFVAAIRARGSIMSDLTVSASGRRLILYCRNEP